MNTAQQDDFRAFVAEGSGLNTRFVIPANEGGPLPAVPYATVLERNDVRQGTANRVLRLNGSDTRADYAYRQLASMSIQFFRRGARANARAFIDWLDTDLGRLEADKIGIRVEGPYRSKNLDDIVSEGWEERAGIDVIVKYVDTMSQDLGRIETATVAVMESATDATINIEAARS